MVNIFPSANVPGHPRDGAVPGGQPAGHTKQILRSICDMMLTIMNSESETSNKLLHDMSTIFFYYSSFFLSPYPGRDHRKDAGRIN